VIDAALANLNHDRAKAEALFERAMRKKPREFDTPMISWRNIYPSWGARFTLR
jgi:hypothetical protein